MTTEQLDRAWFLARRASRRGGDVMVEVEADLVV